MADITKDNSTTDSERHLHDRVNELFHYDARSGSFSWKNSRSTKRLNGRPAGSVSHKGRRILQIDGKRYGAEQLVWLLERGELPKGKIGHLDGRPGNSAISNLVITSRDEFTRNDIDHADLLDLLEYCKDSGEFRWKSRPLSEFSSARGWAIWKTRYVGQIAGYKGPGGYVEVRVKKKLYKAHRLAWFYVYGKWPADHIDHINGDPSDNRLCNLRDVHPKLNQQNVRRPRVNNKVGVLGVIEAEGRYVAQISIDGRSTYIGRFDSAEEAGEAYVLAKRKHHPGCTI